MLAVRLHYFKNKALINCVFLTKSAEHIRQVGSFPFFRECNVENCISVRFSCKIGSSSINNEQKV